MTTRIAGHISSTCLFRPLRVPLAQARLALITTAAPYQPGLGEQGPGAPYNAAAKFYKVYSEPTDSVPDVRIAHVGYDRIHTTAADPNTWLPLRRLQKAVKARQSRCADSTLSRRANEPEPSGHDRDGRPGAPPTVPGR